MNDWFYQSQELMQLQRFDLAITGFLTSVISCDYFKIKAQVSAAVHDTLFKQKQKYCSALMKQETLEGSVHRCGQMWQ